MNDLVQNSSYQKLTGMNIEIDDLPCEENLMVNDDIFTPILDNIGKSMQQDIILSTSDLQEFNNGNEDSDVESDIDMPLEELFDMISGGIGNNWMSTGPQSGLSLVGSQPAGLISDWYPFPNKEVC